MKELDLNKKKRILIIMIVIGLLLILIIGAALAYMAPNINNTETSSTIVFNSGTVAIVYENGENQINAKDVLPGWTAIKEFSVTAKNNTEIDASDVMNYALKLVVEKNTFSSGAITYKLEGVNVNNNGTLAYILPNTLNSGASKINLGYGTFEQADALIKGVTHKYTLTLAFPNKTYESQSSDMGKQLSAYITIEKPSELAKLTITDAEHNINNITINVEKNVEFDLSNPGYANNKIFNGWKLDSGTATIVMNHNTLKSTISVSTDSATVSSIYYSSIVIDYTEPSDDNSEPKYEFVVPYSGVYKLEAWGAQGGYGNDESKYYGGYGGYSVGSVHLYKGDKIYVVIGGKGASSTSKKAAAVAGGYNGGGAGYGATDKYVSGGGGATHIALDNGLLTTFENKKDKLLLVAAGGGGGATTSSSNYGIGGSGGGFNGVKSSNIGNSFTSTGATQDSSGTGYYPGTFGKGGCNATANGCAGGGGGLYGGDSARYSGGGAGGSSYIANSLLTNKSMYCYNCTESTEESTKTISTTCLNETPTENCAKVGNGYAKITIETIEENTEYSTITVVNEEYQTVTTIETKKGTKILLPIDPNSEYIFDKYAIEKGTAEIDGTNITPTSDILVIKVVNLPYKKSSEFAYIEPTTNNPEPYYTFTAPQKGTYKIETWGAQGGYGYDETKYPGGYGGYSTGYIQLNKGEKIYIYVGGKGTSAKEKIAETIPGGYNGGGNGRGADNKFLSGGGGATHISKESGLLTTFENKKENLLIVAAGGGGSAYSTSNNYGTGGSAGGFHGVKSTNVGESANTSGATQTGSGTGKYPGIFGQGGCNSTSESCAGGGSGLYGGDSNRYAGGGAGGSSYIANTLLSNKSMFCYKCEESTDENTYTINTTGTSEYADKENCPNGYSADAISKCAKAGNGHARITFISEN